MINVVGVRFREVGKIYDFAPNPEGDQYKTGDHVIVSTSQGIDYGTVVIPERQIEESSLKTPVKEIMRHATDEDEEKIVEFREKEKQAYKIGKEKIKEHGLDMKMISVEYSFEGNKITFFFTADGRIDFRDLVKDLASIFRVRIELRQVGVRDETKIVGGMGGCGRPLCCHSYLSDFVPVSIRMAKEQNLSLNPQKISGVCGRLMCCLKNEADTYAYLNRKLPKIGDLALAQDGTSGVVTQVSVLRQKVKILVIKQDEEKEILEYPAEELTYTPRKKKAQNSAKVRQDTENVRSSGKKVARNQEESIPDITSDEDILFTEENGEELAESPSYPAGQAQKSNERQKKRNFSDGRYPRRGSAGSSDVEKDRKKRNGIKMSDAGSGVSITMQDRQTTDKTGSRRGGTKKTETKNGAEAGGNRQPKRYRRNPRRPQSPTGNQ